MESSLLDSTTTADRTSQLWKERRKEKKEKENLLDFSCLWKGLLGRGNFFAEWQREESHLSPLMHVIMSKGPSKRDRRSKKKRKEIQQLRMRSKYVIATYPSKILSLENIWNALTETIKRPGACYRNMWNKFVPTFRREIYARGCTQWFIQVVWRVERKALPLSLSLPTFQTKREIRMIVEQR